MAGFWLTRLVDSGGWVGSGHLGGHEPPPPKQQGQLAQQVGFMVGSYGSRKEADEPFVRPWAAPWSLMLDWRTRTWVAEAKRLERAVSVQHWGQWLIYGGLSRVSGVLVLCCRG